MIATEIILPIHLSADYWLSASGSRSWAGRGLCGLSGLEELFNLSAVHSIEVVRNLETSA
jgi:hypothetical protein